MQRGKRNKTTRGFSEPRLVQVCRLLNRQRARYLVVGGVACNLHGLMRATNDIDLLIPKEVRNTEAVLEALKGLTFGIASELDAEEVTRKPFTIIGDTPRVDLLTVAHHVKFDDAITTAEWVTIDKVKIPYADLATLIKTKATDRLQDRADIEHLQRLKKK